MSDKKEIWIITSREIVKSKVLFEHAVTKEEAVALCMGGDYEDIADTDTVDTEEAWIDED